MWVIQKNGKTVSEEFESRSSATVAAFERGYVVEQRRKGHKHIMDPAYKIVEQREGEEKSNVSLRQV